MYFKKMIQLKKILKNNFNINKFKNIYYKLTKIKYILNNIHNYKNEYSISNNYILKMIIFAFLLYLYF